MNDVNVGISKRKLYPLLLLHIAKKIEGTTRFQKLMFILKQEFNVPIDQKFIRYHYGPFSSELRDDISFFMENGLIEQKSQVLGEDPQGYPIIQTIYELSDKGQNIVNAASFGVDEKEVFSKVVENWNKKPLKEVITHAKSLLGISDEPKTA